MEARRHEFVKLIEARDETGCLEYIAQYDGFYDAIADNYSQANMLQWACAHKLSMVATKLIDQKCDLKHQDRGGFTAIMYASFHDLMDVTTYIIDKSTDRTTLIANQMSEMMML